MKIPPVETVFHADRETDGRTDGQADRQAWRTLGKWPTWCTITL